MKAFVTGGTGFVGANLVRSLLDKNYHVRALVRPQSSWDNLDGLNIERVVGDFHAPNLSQQMAGCQVLFHCGAHYSLWQRDAKALYYDNVVGTQKILAAAREVGIERTVYTSSVAAIGVGNGQKPVDETHQSPLNELIGEYKKSKYLAEQEAHKAVKLGQDIVIVNPSTPIGPWDRKPTPTGDIMVRFLRGKMPAYVDTGLNFIDVRDVAEGHILALDKGKRGDRYILGNQNLTLKTFLEYLAEITGIPAPTQTVPLWLPLTVAWIDEILLAPLGKSPSVPLDGVRMSQHSMYYDASKAVRELGLPQSNIKGAIKEAVEWFQ
ncbi:MULTISPECIES: hopanoid-associated sugar epimerase [unclassified Roseofilum]|uniref:hopanoid-associated sugar epimerase n=1 Tax=unclassified Roseofilum TaxID=2620099 RepID=UPI001B06714B|nr:MULTISPECIES: hopanoid-associated sugar epimerase [unclassified Roseofilum]MBP0008770.1 NAD-dependent epimerase/dehydratase family protein [Roseofilum sp. Belize Diploria]MBP0032267.1 NAD-dependent epimerase/dehydratase family protein [Roseofilum sp. Belize BBD 4]